jgi:hypothetical protein
MIGLAQAITRRTQRVFGDNFGRPQSRAYASVDDGGVGPNPKEFFAQFGLVRHIGARWQKFEKRMANFWRKGK